MAKAQINLGKIDKPVIEGQRLILTDIRGASYYAITQTYDESSLELTSGSFQQANGTTEDLTFKVKRKGKLSGYLGNANGSMAITLKVNGVTVSQTGTSGQLVIPDTPVDVDDVINYTTPNHYWYILLTLK